MKRILSLIAIFLLTNVNVGFTYNWSNEEGNYSYTEVITRAWKDGNYNGYYSGVPFLNKIGNEDILYYPYSWSNDYDYDNGFGYSDTERTELAKEIHAYKNGSFYNLGNMSFEDKLRDSYLGIKKHSTFVGTTKTHMLYIRKIKPSNIKTIYSAPVRNNNLDYGKDNRDILYRETKLVDLEKTVAETSCSLPGRFLEKRLPSYNFAVSQKVNEDGVTYNFAYISDNDRSYYKTIIFYYKNSRTNKYRYMEVPFSDNTGDMFIDIGFIDDEDSPYNFYLIQSNYNKSKLHLFDVDFEEEDYEVREITLSTKLFKGLDYCFDGNKAVFDRKNKTIFYISQYGNTFQRYAIYSTYIDLLNNKSSEPIIIKGLSDQGNNISAIEGIGITKQPYENKLAIISNYERISRNHYRKYTSFQELGILEYELNLPEEEEGIYMDSEEYIPTPGLDPMTPKVGVGGDFKVGIRTLPPQELTLNEEYDRKSSGGSSYRGYTAYNQVGERPPK